MGFITGLLGIGGGILVIPILVVEKMGPITALSESAALLKKTWGEQLIGNFSYGLVFFLLGLPAILPLIFGYVTGTKEGMFVGIGLAIIYLLFLALIQSALQAIFQAALYLYARDGQVPPGFQADLLTNAITRR